MLKLSPFQIIPVTDLRTKKESFKIFARGTAGREEPLVRDIPTRAEAQAKVKELEQAQKEQK